jgi:CheY-like chemotaxis protein
MGRERLVLIVDDDEDIRAALCAVLEEVGYDPRAVANGREALDLLRAGPLPSLILLDLMMPVMDGWQFRAVQRADPALSRIPVVAITASGFSSEIVAQLGVQRCLAKPLQIETLIETLRVHIDAGRDTPDPVPLRRAG